MYIEHLYVSAYINSKQKKKCDVSKNKKRVKIVKNWLELLYKLKNNI